MDILAEVGFDRMTMDMVASRGGTGKATIYRRWNSKAELVRDALIWMSQQSVELGKLPDTGSLRGDLLAVLKPYSAEHQQRKSLVLSGLGSFLSQNQEIADETRAGIFEPMVQINTRLMKRALERAEISPVGDIDLACQVIISVVSYRTQNLSQSFDRAYYSELLDRIILPALKREG